MLHRRALLRIARLGVPDGDVVTGAEPKYLGPRVDVAGSARASRG